MIGENILEMLDKNKEKIAQFKKTEEENYEKVNIRLKKRKE